MHLFSHHPLQIGLLMNDLWFLQSLSAIAFISEIREVV